MNEILEEDGNIYLIHKLDEIKEIVEKIAYKDIVQVWEILKEVSEKGESDKDSVIAVNNWLKDNWEGKKGSKRLSEKRILSICKYYKD